MKLSDIKGEDAIDVLADLIEPVAKVLADGEVQKIYQSGQPKVLLAKYIMKHNKKEVVEILAALERENPKEYAEKINVLTLPVKLLELLNDEDLLNFFSSQIQNTELTSSGPVTENIEVEEK